MLSVAEVVACGLKNLISISSVLFSYFLVAVRVNEMKNGNVIRGTLGIDF